MYTMTDKEIRRHHVINCAIEGKNTVKEAAKLLNLSERRIKQLKKEVRKAGVEAVIHGNKQHRPIHSLSAEIKDRIISLKTSYAYELCNFAHFQELLEENEGIVISYSALHSLLTKAGIKSPKKHRKHKKHLLRARKPAEGMMLQADGTPHDWFCSGKKQSLHGFIDDATGTITGLYMCEAECLFGYLEVTRQTIKNHGVPLSLYPDKYSVFFPTQKKEYSLSIEEELAGMEKAVTQFGRIMRELGVEMFPANTPQAKGRIERLWGTLQSRLVSEFRIRDVRNIEEANKFLPGYIKKYNDRFAIKPSSDKNAFLPLPAKFNLDTLLCVRIPRVTDNSGVISIHNCRFVIADNNVPPRAKVTILLSKESGMRAEYKGKLFPVRLVLPLKSSLEPEGTLANVTKKLMQEYFFKDAKAA